MLRRHSTDTNHPFSLSEIENLVKEIQNPVAVYKSATVEGDFVIQTSLEKNGKPFIVSLRISEENGEKVGIITGIYPTEGGKNKIYSFINNHLTIKADKKKINEWHPVKGHNALSETGEPLIKSSEDMSTLQQKSSSAAKIIQEFDNTKFFEEEYCVLLF
jgi:hypothetical protein